MEDSSCSFTGYLYVPDFSGFSTTLSPSGSISSVSHGPQPSEAAFRENM